MKKNILFFICFLVFQISIEGYELTNTEDLKSIKAVLYYNSPSLYTDVRRTYNDVLNGRYEVKKEFSFEDFKDFDSLERLFSIQPVVITDQIISFPENIYVTSICVVYINSEITFIYTYDECKDNYCIYNGKSLIERNTIYDNFARYLIDKIKLQ